MRSAYLVGPFVGELNWEFYRFAPYIITLKKRRSKIKVIVFTRKSRFDLYGQYADILIPLKIPNDLVKNQKGFTISKLTDVTYQQLANKFYSKYKNRFRILSHIYPDISYFYHKLRWQFPRELMDYDFKPRGENIKFIRNYVKDNKFAFINFNFSEKHDIVETLEKYDYFPIFVNLLTEEFSFSGKKGKSLLGCIIEIIKRSDFVISKFNTYITHLALLLKTPVVCVGRKPSNDEVTLINPFNTKVIYCDNEEDGIKLLKEQEDANYI